MIGTARLLVGALFAALLGGGVACAPVQQPPGAAAKAPAILQLGRVHACTGNSSGNCVTSNGGDNCYDPSVSYCTHNVVCSLSDGAVCESDTGAVRCFNPAYNSCHNGHLCSVDHPFC